MPSPKRPPADPMVVLQTMRGRIRGGERPSLSTLNDAEMAAAGELIRTGEAKIGSAACRPILLAAPPQGQGLWKFVSRIWRRTSHPA